MSRIYACEVCGSWFESGEKLRAHYVIHPKASFLEHGEVRLADTVLVD